MFVRQLPPDRGALFIFDENGPHSFWMRNTYVPLDIIFVAEDGTVTEVVQGRPFDEMIIGSELPSRFAVEALHGFASANGIGSGSHMRVVP